MTWLVCSVKMMEASDNQINTFNGHGPGGRVAACTKKPALMPACLVDYTGKIPNLLGALRRLKDLCDIKSEFDDSLANPRFNVFPIGFLEHEGHGIGFGVLKVSQTLHGDKQGSVRILLHVEFQKLLQSERAE